MGFADQHLKLEVVMKSELKCLESRRFWLKISLRKKIQLKKLHASSVLQEPCYLSMKFLSCMEIATRINITL